MWTFGQVRSSLLGPKVEWLLEWYLNFMQLKWRILFRGIGVLVTKSPPVGWSPRKWWYYIRGIFPRMPETFRFSKYNNLPRYVCMYMYIYMCVYNMYVACVCVCQYYLDLSSVPTTSFQEPFVWTTSPPHNLSFASNLLGHTKQTPGLYRSPSRWWNQTNQGEVSHFPVLHWPLGCVP